MNLSVIIPTFNRCEILLRTLTALARQKSESFTFEILVVDDGSTDQTAEQIRQFTAQFPVPFTYLYQRNKKQGAARNLAARQARGELLIFLGDDTVPQAGFLEAHLRSRSQFPVDDDTRKKLVVLGYTTWPPDFQVTRFLEYIGEHGWQFGFSLIDDPEDVPFNYFYTSNVSLDRGFFLHTGGFDEAFREYGWEDIELSLRLKKSGMRMVYRPAAVTYHYHPTNFASFKERQFKVGYSAWSFYRLHPEMEAFLNVNRAPELRIGRQLQMKLLGFACSLTEQWRWPDLSRFYPDLMSHYYLLGLKRARRESGGPSPLNGGPEIVE